MNEDHNARQHRREAAQIIANSNGLGQPIGGSGQRARAAAASPSPAEPIDYSRPHVEVHVDFGAEGHWVELSDQRVIEPAPAAEGTRYLEIMFGDDQ